MAVLASLIQEPSPGVHIVRFRGDVMRFALEAPFDRPGRAWLRTNIGRAAVMRREILREVRHNESPPGRDWFDIPMKPEGGRRWAVTVPLSEVGHFQAKAYFMAEDDPDPVWPEGPNTAVNVEPADTCSGNIVYNAFVRQFGPNKDGNGKPSESQADCVRNLDAAGYAVIPKSGTFRDLIRELDFIVDHLGCRYLQLLPIHPTPTTYGRMGRFGSPYAALNFTEVDPALAEFDLKATPLEQFIELVDAVHARHARILMDIAINHTGWAASLHETHPQWLSRDPEGRIEMPGAWGVTWADLTKLDYRHRGLWAYMAEVFLTWCGRGVDGFRCDAGYMVPAPAWRFIVAAVREQYPDTLFFLEGLGGKISVTRDLLNTANLNWAYSELFQNYDRGQIESYLPETLSIGRTDGLMIHFCETHDNNRLAARSRSWARMRVALCALCSQNGGFAFANGVEWFATEKINVHESSSLNWGASDNQIDWLRRLSILLKTHPAFGDHTESRMIQKGEGNGILLLRRHIPTGIQVLIAVNLEDARPTVLSWEKSEGAGVHFFDFLTEKWVRTGESSHGLSLMLEPGEALCMGDPSGCPEYLSAGGRIPVRNLIQRLRAKVLDIYGVYHPPGDVAALDMNADAHRLERDPEGFCREMNPLGDESRVVPWQWPADVRREVMVPPGHFVLVWADHPFTVIITSGSKILRREESLPRAASGQTGRRWFAVISPLPPPVKLKRRTLRISVHEANRSRREDALLVYLPKPDGACVRRFFRRTELLKTPLLLLGVNGRGAMMRAHAAWGRLASRYDALLAANLSPDFPEDRWILFTRCRAWVVFQGFSCEVNLDCLRSFQVDEFGRGFWEYRIPTGQGEDISFYIGMEMLKGKNAMRIGFIRGRRGAAESRLSDDRPVRLILRPDIEDRRFHDVTKAYTGPEHQWPKAVAPFESGFFFAPAEGRRLKVELSGGVFHPEPEWHYMVHRPLEAGRGLDPDSDLFSPGYFSATLSGGSAVELSAQVTGEGEATTPLPPLFPDVLQTIVDSGNPSWDMTEGLLLALDAYVVERRRLRTVIAGYPWFLDWGRDTLIFVRGMIASGRLSESRAILKQFAKFEKNGTLPNMIRGDDAGNRNTSDAPLWFFVAVSDLLTAESSDDFLNEICDGRSIREILHSIGVSLAAGADNGVRMDPESGLLFSPSHFTWMDTNYPAGTPREGYPVEIQAMWYFSLNFLARITADSDPQWETLADGVKRNIVSRFFMPDRGYLADCLHARPGVAARDAEKDDALRPNQLLALTLDVVTDRDIQRRVLDACRELLVPGAIRSLADRPVNRPLEIIHNGRRLNDPSKPYHGRYEGDEDTRRKPAYHNGAAWTWLFPSFCEAWAECYKDDGRDTSAAWLASVVNIINAGCVGHVPEILDGDAPHTARGCDAQAWGVSEALRVWIKLQKTARM